MTYQVLARKYRPANFSELEGQEHVLRALINSLDNNRLHHAYLFSGTRGVGKTTIARILAKCLNCDEGVTSKPCGQCASCREIAEGRSVDLIEVDAASRTGVDDMRELLENVQYLPSVSRFKVYLIDEVHMLSRNSFNAMLKTLEEPPEHVKFLFATTDPKKLPITVLSRCLQFNLKNMSPEQVVNYLSGVLGKESITYEESALWPLGWAADGSMRDALSLTDQAISYSDGNISESNVKAMLGSIDQQDTFKLLESVLKRDADQVLSQIDEIADFSPDFSALLDEVLSLLHRLQIKHLAPKALDNSYGDKDFLESLSGLITNEEIQLLYQIGIIGRRDMAYAPTDRSGFEMTLLRMIAFTLLDIDDLGPLLNGEVSDNRSPVSDILDTLKNGPKSKLNSNSKGKVQENTLSTGEKKSSTTEAQSFDGKTQKGESFSFNVPVQKDQSCSQETSSALNIEGMAWQDILNKLKLGGVTKTLAANCTLASYEDHSIRLVLDEQHASLLDETYEARISSALGELTGTVFDVKIKIGLTEGETPAKALARKHQEVRAEAAQVIENDTVIQTLIQDFDGKLDRATITPNGTGDL